MTKRVGTTLMLAIAAAALAVAACEKKDEASKPSGVPPLEGTPAAPAMPATPTPSAPAAPSAPSAAAPAAAPAAPTPGPAPAAPPPAAEAPPPAAGAGGSIVGEIVLAPSQKANVNPGDAIFLVARRISDNPSARGSLVAVKRFTAGSFPIPFTMSAEDMPFQGGTFDGELTLMVRVDKDGDPMSRKKGDVIGSIPKVRVGAKGVKIRIDQVQKEDESLTGGGPMMGR